MASEQDAKAFRPFVHPSKGRGLQATRVICPGEEVLREEPTAIVLGATAEHSSGGDAECHEMLRQILCVPPALAKAVAQLVSSVEACRQRDTALLDDVAVRATPAVRALVASQAGEAAAAAVDEMAVVEAYCKHTLNSMCVTCAESLQVVGMAMYAQHGALLNHDNRPNCWTIFERNGASYTLVVRSLTAIATGDELTIAYVDVAQPAAQLAARLYSHYHIPRETSLSAGRSSAMGWAALVEVERIGVEAGGGSFMEAHLLHRGAGGSSSRHDAKVERLAAALATGSKAELTAELVAAGSAGSLDQVERVALAHSELAKLVAGEPAEPAVLIPAATRALEAALRKGEWCGVYACCQQLLYLYRFYYREVYPQAPPPARAPLASMVLQPPTLLRPPARRLAPARSPRSTPAAPVWPPLPLCWTRLAQETPGRCACRAPDGGQSYPYLSCHTRRGARCDAQRG